MSSRQIIIGSLAALLVILAAAMAAALGAPLVEGPSASAPVGVRSELAMEWANPALLIPLAAICLPIMGLAAILGFVLLLRYMRMKETAMLLEREATPEVILQQRVDRPSRAILFTGIIVSMIGLALGIALYPIGSLAGSRSFLGLGPWMLPGLLPLFIGIALILWHSLSQEGQNGSGKAP